MSNRCGFELEMFLMNFCSRGGKVPLQHKKLFRKYKTSYLHIWSKLIKTMLNILKFCPFSIFILAVIHYSTPPKKLIQETSSIFWGALRIQATSKYPSETRINITSWTLSWQRSLSYRSQSIDLHCKSIGWFLYDRNLRYERVKTGHFQYHFPRGCGSAN